jgi:hypothetical protein
LIGARVTLILSLICALVGFLIVVIEFLLCRIPCAGCVSGTIYMLAWVCGASAFTLWGSDLCAGTASAECELGTGAIYNIVAVALYFVSSFIVCCLPKSPGLACRKGKDKKEEEEDEEDHYEPALGPPADHNGGPPQDAY